MPTSTQQQQQGFNLQTAENSQELHDKLSNILERFEQTRQAIKDNVNLLEGISDSTSAIGQDGGSQSSYYVNTRTGNSTLDSAYPHNSINRKSRSRSYTRLSSMDTGTSSGLRTISSVDSGVMLTLTSCSEAGTQSRSRSRSFDSWLDSSSAFDTLDTDVGGKRALTNRYGRINRQPTIEQSDSEDVSDQEQHSSEEDSSSSPQSSDGEKDDQFTQSVSDADNDYKAQQSGSSRRKGSDTSSVGESAYDTDRFETQEYSISFTDDEDIYHVLSPSSQEQSPEVLSPRSNQENPESVEENNGSHHTSIVITASDPQNNSNENAKNFASEACIVLPAVERVRNQSRPSSLDLHSPHSVSHPSSRPGIFEWKNKDRISLHHSTDSSDSSIVNHLSASTSRLIFSPIPEESPSEFTPVSLYRAHRGPGQQPFAQYTQSPLTHSTKENQRFQRSPQRTIQVAAQVHSHPFNTYTVEQHRENIRQFGIPEIPEIPEAVSPYHPQLDERGRKLRKLRRRRKKQPVIQSPQYGVLASSTSSATSSVVSSNLHTRRSDADLSLGSYHNAIHRHAIQLPPVNQFTQTSKVGGAEDVHSTSSCTSSPSYYDIIYTTSSDSSSDTEYDYQVSMQNLSRTPYNTSKYQGRRLPKIRADNSERRASVTQQPPVMKKIVKDKNSTMSLKKEEQGERKSRLFTKNSSPKLTASRKKLMKTKSDEASNSLLRYFRFPSPPRHSGDNSDSGSTDLTKHTKIKSHNRLSGNDYDDCKMRVRGQRSSADSFSSCSSTTDTASDIAYPDLPKQSTRHHQLLTTPILVPHIAPQAMAAPPPPQPEVLSLTDNPRTFTLHVKPTKSEKKGKGCGSLFDRLFRRNKKNESPQQGKHNSSSKLTLDLAGGEVRIRSQSLMSPSTAQPNNSISFISLPGTEATTGSRQHKVQCVDELPIQLHTPPSSTPSKSIDQASISEQATSVHTAPYSQHPASNYSQHPASNYSQHPASNYSMHLQDRAIQGQYYATPPPQLRPMPAYPPEPNRHNPQVFMVPMSAPETRHRGYVVQNYPDIRYRDVYQPPTHHQYVSPGPSVYYNRAYTYSPEERLRTNQIFPHPTGATPMYRRMNSHQYVTSSPHHRVVRPHPALTTQRRKLLHVL